MSEKPGGAAELLTGVAGEMALRLRGQWDALKAQPSPTDVAACEREARAMAVLARLGAAIFAFEAAEKKAEDVEVKRRARRAAAREEAGVDEVAGDEFQRRADTINSGIDRFEAAHERRGRGRLEPGGSVLAPQLGAGGGAMAGDGERRAA